MKLKGNCPYKLEYDKLSDEEKAEYNEPCNSEECLLDPSICRVRLIWAYNKLNGRE